MPTLIYKAKHKGLIKDFKRDQKRPAYEISGSFIPRSRVLEISEAAFCGANEVPANPLGREAIAHELGHAWLAHTNTRNFSRVGSATLKKIRSDEWQAEYFTSAFLMPRKLVQYTPNVRASELSVQFVVTPHLATLRIKQLAKLRLRSSSVTRPLPKEITDFLSNKKAYLHTPCKTCGKLSVRRERMILICDRCGTQN